jgi:hypothetical protein
MPSYHNQESIEAKPSKIDAEASMESEGLLRERLVKIETVVAKDQAHTNDSIEGLEAQLQSLSRDFHVVRGELNSVAALFNLFQALDQKYEVDRQKREREHSEIISLLSKKMDNDRPVKWALNFQSIIKWIAWLIAILGAFGVGNVFHAMA